MGTHIYTLTAGGTYEIAALQCFLGNCCKQSSAVFKNYINIYYTEVR